MFKLYTFNWQVKLNMLLMINRWVTGSLFVHGQKQPLAL